MKKIIFRIGISVSILIVALLVFSGYYFYKFTFEVKKMTPLKTGFLTNGIYSIDNKFVNLFIVHGKDKYIAIDAGNDSQMVGKELKKISISPESITAVFLTHTDSDHTAAINLFKAAKIYLSKEEERMINGKTHRLGIFSNKLDAPYNLLDDGQVLDVPGLKIKCILTPGHTPGSMCYIINDKYLFTGDTLSLKNGSVEIFNKFFNMDSTTEKKSISKLKNLTDIKYIFTAHYGYSDDFKKAFENWKN